MLEFVSYKNFAACGLIVDHTVYCIAILSYLQMVVLFGFLVGYLVMLEDDSVNVSMGSSCNTVALQPFQDFVRNCELNVSEQEIDEIVSLFLSYGAETMSDLKFLSADDLADVLPKIKCRKLMDSIANISSSRSISEQALTPLQFDNHTYCSDPGSASSSSTSSILCVDNDFTVPLERFSGSVKQCLTDQKRPTPKQQREVVRVLCDKVMELKSSPRRSDIRRIAEMFVQKYALSFEDRSLGNKKIQIGASSLHTQMENRLYNLKRISTSSSDTEPKMKKSKLTVGNWNPSQNFTDEEIEEMRVELNKMFEDECTEEDEIKIIFQKCYPTIRQLINTMSYSSMAKLKQNWPILFTFSGMKLHYNFLMHKK